METIPSRLPFHGPTRRVAARPSWLEPRAADPHALRIERILAILRCPLAALGLVSILIYPSDSHLLPMATRLLVVYLASAAGVVIYLSGVRALPVPLPYLLHAADIFMAVAVPLFLGIFSPISVSLIYPLLAGAYRWGVVGALVTTMVTELSVVAYALLVTDTGLLGRPGSEMTTLLLHAISIPVVGGLAGYLVHVEKQREREAIDLVTVLRSARMSGEFDQTVALALGALIKMFGASQVVLVVSDPKSDATFLWRSEATGDGLPTHEQLELRPEQRPDYFFDLGAAVCCYIDRKRRHIRMLVASGRRIHIERVRRTPHGFLRRHPFNRMVCVVLKSTDTWSGRLFVLEPRRRLRWQATAQQAMTICSELDPDIESLYRVHHLRVRAQAVERARIARELHDGVTQSLLGLELVIAVLRRRILQEAPALDHDLLHIHDLVRENIIGLREVTESGHLVETMSGNLLADLEEIVDRFQRHSGIMAKFVSDGRQVALTRHRHGELARLVHEALVNVRKHSGAHRVIVRSTVADRLWIVSLEDDGRGFPFGGRRTQMELDRHREGPRTVIERARRLGAEVAVESRPGCGSRVEIVLRLPVE